MVGVRSAALSCAWSDGYRKNQPNLLHETAAAPRHFQRRGFRQTQVAAIISIQELPAF
jgi:hypothetical protein